VVVKGGAIVHIQGGNFDLQCGCRLESPSDLLIDHPVLFQEASAARLCINFMDVVSPRDQISDQSLSIGLCLLAS
jgi:hypothetical protein